MVRLTTDQVLNCRKKLEGIMGSYAYLMSREEIQEVIKNIQDDPFVRGSTPIRKQQHRPGLGSHVWAAKDAKINNDL